MCGNPDGSSAWGEECASLPELVSSHADRPAPTCAISRCATRIVSTSWLLSGAFAWLIQMRGTQFAELTAFAAVAEHANFAKAAGQLAIAPQTLSDTIRSLEARRGVRPLNRPTRS